MAYDSDNRTLYIGNLHKNVNEELLYELFLQAGPIEKVSVHGTSNKNFHYGFVTYIHSCAIDYAIQLFKGTCLFKKRLLIKRKGEKNNDHPIVYSDKTISDNVPTVEKLLNRPLDDMQALTLQKMYQIADYYNDGRNDNDSPGVMQNSRMGHWSDRHRPYEHETRRHHSSRPIKNYPRDHQRNNSRSHYNKSYKERKGRY